MDLKKRQEAAKRAAEKLKNKGDGKGIAAPPLVNTWGDKAVPADLRQPHLRSGNDPEDIYRVLMTGLNGTPMLSFAEAFTAEQKWELVAHVIELRQEHARKEIDRRHNRAD